MINISRLYLLYLCLAAEEAEALGIRNLSRDRAVLSSPTVVPYVHPTATISRHASLSPRPDSSAAPIWDLCFCVWDSQPLLLPEGSFSPGLPKPYGFLSDLGNSSFCFSLPVVLSD